MRRVLLVFAGGFCGTLARVLLGAPLLALARWVGMPAAHGGFPYDIFAINLSGALAMGLLYGLFERGAAIPPDVRLTLGTGFLGAYTTFSTFVVGGDKLLPSASLTGLVYLFGSLALGVLCAALGYEAASVFLDWRRIRRRAAVHVRRVGRATLATAPLATWVGQRVTPRASRDQILHRDTRPGRVRYQRYARPTHPHPTRANDPADDQVPEEEEMR